MKKQDTVFRIIAFIMIVSICPVNASAQENAITSAIIGCSKCITDCANNVISLTSDTLTSESTEIDEEYYSEYPEGYDPYDPIVMGEVDPCLTGQAVGAVMKDVGINIGGKMAVAGIKKTRRSTQSNQPESRL